MSEVAPNIGKRSPSAYIRSWRRLRCLLQEDISDEILLEIELMGLSVAVGITDVTIFPEYHLFVANQTGNTVLLAVGALKVDGDIIDLKKVGFSLGMFLIGAYSLGQMGDIFGRRKRGWLIATNVIQTCLVFIASALRHWVALSSAEPPTWSVISLLAFAMAGQVAMARTINVPEITTAVITSAYIDLLVDPHIFHPKNRPRNRRFFFVCSLLLGSFIGAVAYKYVGAAFALLLTGIVKSAVCAALFFNRAIPKPEVENMMVEQDQP